LILWPQQCIINTVVEVVMARPKSDNPKNHVIKVRMTEEEYERLLAYATRNDQTMSDVISKSLDKTYSSEKDKK